MLDSVVIDDDTDDLLELLTLSAVVLSLKILFTLFAAALLLVDVIADDNLFLPSPPELLLDSLSSTENGNAIANIFHLIRFATIGKINNQRSFQLSSTRGGKNMRGDRFEEGNGYNVILTKRIC